MPGSLPMIDSSAPSTVMVTPVSSAAVSSRLASEASENNGRSAKVIAHANPTVEPSRAHAVSAVSKSAKPLQEKSNIVGDGSIAASKFIRHDLAKRSLESAVDQINHSRLNSAELSFYVHEPTQKFVVEVKDKESGEVVGQFPTETAIRVAQSINALIRRESGSEELRGLLLDRSA
ncbi:MAG TPA: hypothetical protein DCL66_00665 [Gammaproteobacteria bacterium]|nr:hypothetical protein [Gammaproteobacteria bacterium]